MAGEDENIMIQVDQVKCRRSLRSCHPLNGPNSDGQHRNRRVGYRRLSRISMMNGNDRKSRSGHCGAREAPWWVRGGNTKLVLAGVWAEPAPNRTLSRFYRAFFTLNGTSVEGPLKPVSTTLLPATCYFYLHFLVLLVVGKCLLNSNLIDI